MFEFAWPWRFLLLPLPWLLRHCCRPPTAANRHCRSKLSRTHLESPSPAGAPAGACRTCASSGRSPAIWLLLLLAAARPEWLGEPHAATRPAAAT